LPVADAEKEQTLKQLDNALQERTMLSKELASTKASVKELESWLENERTSIKQLQEKIERLQAALHDAELSYNSLEKRFGEGKVERSIGGKTPRS
jgi:peptidoglycan hydrolase CwlO-like protein